MWGFQQTLRQLIFVLPNAYFQRFTCFADVTSTSHKKYCKHLASTGGGHISNRRSVYSVLEMVLKLKRFSVRRILFLNAPDMWGNDSIMIQSL
jgi:hypothetical protein